ncbi:MAG: CPBP family intramembrane metalloprotease [Bacteroidetes bacterium]|nr:CPBP family intramembrane metalloprotease [Bacteroidota bacterium]
MATWLLLKIDKKTFAEINLVWQNSSLMKFIKGVILGSFIFGVLLSVLLLFADIEIQNSSQGMSLSAAAAYLSIIPLALAEEIAFRAFPFIKLERAFGLRITQWIVAIVFAAYHVVIGWDLLAAFLGPGIWAFVFGLSARWSGGIAMPTGIHVALNVWQPLVGMSPGTYTSVWILKNNQAISPGQISKADLTGIVLQAIILIAAILLTEYYIKKRTRYIEN